ncbi:hypothetical protein [Luteolibacter sp. Populi]|uniref:hypothetical protein n=1 Tax=Luteolibacter sp. Populi TaxID=3230487 RepID=UPI00346754EE
MNPISTSASLPPPVRKHDPEVPPDDPSRDENHDETRRNGYDPAVAHALMGSEDKEEE